MKLRFLILLSIFWSCSKPAKVESVQMIDNEASSQHYFKALMAVTEDRIPVNEQQDSLSFLILPLQASCPSCRKKTLDSIIKHKHDLKSRHYIILSTSEGLQAIEGYFYARKSQMPDLKGKMFIDTLNYASQLGLFDLKPTMYYAFHGLVYKRVNAYPQTVKEDLREYFSGYRISSK